MSNGALHRLRRRLFSPRFLGITGLGQQGMDDYCLPERGKAALLTISAQRDFIAPGSPIRIKQPPKTLSNLRRLVTTFRNANLPIFHSVRLYRADGSNADSCRRHLLDEGHRFLMPGSLGSELIDEVNPDPSKRLDPEKLLAGGFQILGSNEQVFYRPRWGAFHKTKLEEMLRAMDVSTLVLCGFSFATGARATIYEASARDFRLMLASDAICGASDAGLAELARIGIYLINSGTCADWLPGQQGIGAQVESAPGPYAA